MVEFEKCLQQCYFFINLLAGYEVRRSELTRRVLAGGWASSYFNSAKIFSDTVLHISSLTADLIWVKLTRFI